MQVSQEKIAGVHAELTYESSSRNEAPQMQRLLNGYLVLHIYCTCSERFLGWDFKLPTRRKYITFHR